LHINKGLLLHQTLVLASFLLSFGVAPSCASQGPLEDGWQVSVYFDVNVGGAGKLQLPLELLEKTLADLDQGHIPYTAG
jgi:hypothetical protein